MIKITPTAYGVQVDNFDELLDSIVPAARKIFKKRLRTKRQKVKYAKKYIERAIKEHCEQLKLSGVINDNQENGKQECK